MKKLFVFTKSFPYGKTEAFFEGEIVELSKSFDEIIIIPYLRYNFIRNIPNNVKIDNSLSIAKVKSGILLITVFFSISFVNSFFLHLKKIRSLSDIRNILRYEFQRKLIYSVFKNKVEMFDNSIVYTYWFDATTYALLRYRNKIGANMKIVSRAHRYDVYEEELLPYRSFCLKHINNLFVISEDGKNFLECNYGKNDKIVVSRLGVCDKGLISKSSGVNNIEIISVSQITGRKRVDLVFLSLVEFAKKNKIIKIKWNHFGVGDKKKYLEKLIEMNQVDNLDIYLNGYVNNSEIYNFYINNPVDIFINLSTSEGIPVSIMEALSFGIPVIATNVGGTKEVVNDEVGILLSQNPEINEICNAIQKVIDNRYDKNKIKNKFKVSFDAKINYQNFVNMLIS